MTEWSLDCGRNDIHKSLYKWSNYSEKAVQMRARQNRTKLIAKPLDLAVGLSGECEMLYQTSDIALKQLTL